jgi:hypothetical protein
MSGPAGPGGERRATGGARPATRGDRRASAGSPGRAIRPASLSAVLTWLPVALALLAEAAWIAVVAGLLEALVVHPPVTGIPELLLAAAAGLAAARRLAVPLGPRWTLVGGAMAAGAGLVGWLASGEVLALLVSRGVVGVPSALAVNPGGLLAALAFARGAAHARLPIDPGRLGLVLASVVPALALAAIVGGMIAEPARSAFLATAAWQVPAFLAAALLAQAIARLADVGRGVPVDWRRNPAWLALAVLLVGITAGVSMLIAVYGGSAIATVLAAVLVPALLVGFVVGFDRRSVRLLAMAVFAVGILGSLMRVFSVAPRPLAGIPTVFVPDRTTTDPGVGTALAVFLVALAAAVVVGLVVARYWLRRPRGPLPADDETRTIDRAEPRITRQRRARRFGRWRPRPRPADAVAAYRALLLDLDGRPPVAREPGETPVEHARRLRKAGHGGLSLELLAADYGLARFGGVSLSEAEHRRAVGRFDRLARELRAVEVSPAVAAASTGAGPARAGVARRGAAKVGDDPMLGAKRGGRGSAGPGADLPDAEQPGALEALLERVRRGP